MPAGLQIRTFFVLLCRHHAGGWPHVVKNGSPAPKINTFFVMRKVVLAPMFDSASGMYATRKKLYGQTEQTDVYNHDPEKVFTARRPVAMLTYNGTKREQSFYVKSNHKYTLTAESKKMMAVLSGAALMANSLLNDQTAEALAAKDTLRTLYEALRNRLITEASTESEIREIELAQRCSFKGWLVSKFRANLLGGNTDFVMDPEATESSALPISSPWKENGTKFVPTINLFYVNKFDLLSTIPLA